MSLAAPVCCADRRGPRQPQTMSTGLPVRHAPLPARATPPAGTRRQWHRSPLPVESPRAAPVRWAPSPALASGRSRSWPSPACCSPCSTSWPLVLHLPSRIAPDLGDPVRTAWEIAWVGHAMLHDPLHLFDSNAFYPHPLSLAFSDSLLGYGPAGVLRLGHGRRARPLQPAVPVHVVAVLRRRLPACPRARPGRLGAAPRRAPRSPTPPTG